MNRSKVTQNRLVRTSRYLVVFTLFIVLGLSSLFAAFVYSTFLQKKLFKSFVEPALAAKEITIDFNGLDYVFPNSFSLPNTMIYFQDTEVIRTGTIEVRGLKWFKSLSIDAIFLDTIQVLQTIDGTLLRDMVDSVLDTSSIGESNFFALDETTVHFKGISIPLEDRKEGFVEFYVNQLNVGDDIAADSLFSLLKYEDYVIKIYSNQLNYEQGAKFNVDFLAESPNLVSIQGLLKGSRDAVKLKGEINFLEKPILGDLFDNRYSEIFQHAQYKYELSTDSINIIGSLMGGNESYEIRTKYRGENTGKSIIEGDIIPKESFYNWSLFDGYETIFEFVKPNRAEIKVQTDFSDTDWSLKFIDEQTEIVLNSTGIYKPLRATIQSESLDLGPLNSASAQLSLFPHVKAVFEDESYKVLGVFPSVVSQGKKVRGINASFYHTTTKDTLWLSSLDSNFDIELAASNSFGISKIKGKLNSVSLEILDPLDSGQVLMADVECTFNEEGIGALLLSNAVLARPNDVIFLRCLDVKHNYSSGIRSIELTSDVFDFSMSGRWDIQNILPIKEHIIQDAIVQNSKPWIPADFSFNLNAGDIDWIADLAHLDVTVSEQTHAFGNYNGFNRKWSLEFNIPSFHSNEFSGKSILIKSSQNQSFHSSLIRADSLNYRRIKLKDIALNVIGENNQRGVDIDFIFVDSIPSRVNYNGQFSKDQITMDNLSFNLGTSSFSSTRSGSIVWKDSKIIADSLGVVGPSGAFWLTGNLLSKYNPEINFAVADLDAGVLNYIIRNNNVVLSGKMNANFKLTRSIEEPEVLSNFKFKNFGMNNYTYGNFEAQGSYNEEDQIYISGQMRQGNSSLFTFNSRFDLPKKTIDLRASLDEFAINSFNPLIGGVLDEVRGNLQGGLELYGPIQSYQLNGAFSLTEGHFTVPIVGAELSSNGGLEIRLTENVISLDTGVFFVPRDSTSAEIYGDIFHQRFDSLEFDLKLHSDSILAMNIPRNLDGNFYGSAVVLGDLLLEGPIEQLHMDLVVATKEGTNFKIPLDNPSAIEMPSYIRFTDTNLARTDTTKTKSLEYFTTDISINATPEAQVELVLDEILGDVIKARGKGNLRLRLLEDESLELYGLYTLKSGSYLFTLQNIINKQFEILDGGSILWSGDLYDANIDMNAKYSLSTNLDGLVSNPNYNNENIDVDLIINLSGALMNPEISFSIDLPNAPSSYLEELQRHFLNEDAMNYQAFSLLLLGNFYQQDLAIQEGFDLGSSVQSNTSELLVSEFGSWLAAGIGSYVDLEFDYTSGLNPYSNLMDSENNLNLEVAKDFLNGRLSINSSLDIPIGSEGGSTLLLGDTELVYSLTKDGKIKVRAFNRSNRNDPLMENSGPYTQGVGILFHKEFEKVLKD
ncbi:MAG: translocation/assembly module TamB domain-containing protein [Bacteroidota bacterium]|nr:translocation/assembly module TamB domain-containing protein [Bacteroidota bacterium]